MSEAHDSTARSQDSTARVKSMRVSSRSAPLNPVGKRRTLSPLTPGTFAIRLRSGAHRTRRSHMGKPHTWSPVTPGTFETRFRWLIGRIMATSKHTEIEKNQCMLICDSLGAFSDIELITHCMSALFCRRNFQTNFGTFR